MNKLVRILVWIAGVVVALIVVAVALLWIFFPEDKVRQIAIEKGRKDVEQRKSVIELRSLEHMRYISQVSANAVRISVKHDAFR